MIDEANIESHGIGYDKDVTIADKPEWALAHMARMQAMVERDKNHPSIVIWSLGNESGDGHNFLDLYKWTKERDKHVRFSMKGLKSRPIQPNGTLILYVPCMTGYGRWKPMRRILPATGRIFYANMSIQWVMQPEICRITGML